MKQKRIRLRPISDEEEEGEEGEEKEDGDRRNSLRKSKKIKYIDDYDDEDEKEEEEEEEEDEDQEGNEQPGPSTQNTYDQMAQENRLPVTCGDKKGFLDVEKLSRGEQCILSNGSWLSPPDFEEFGGKGSSKKWKASIFHEDKPLQDLFDKGILTTKGFKRRRSETLKPKKILSSDESESRSEDRGTNLIISASVINALKTVKIVIPRLQEAKTDRQFSCSEHPKEGL
uniref:SAND domain-containing protein n=1 Tax=Lates calcarifer TaxID=8187 RepID=A0A4W6D265_LATCA